MDWKWTFKGDIRQKSNDVLPPKGTFAKAVAANACCYMCCCPCMGSGCCGLARVHPIVPGEGSYGSPKAKILLWHAGKWFICHPCYVSQMLRASKIALDVKKKLTGLAGAPDCNEMER